LGFVDPRISIAMTPGGGAAGIGFDGTGFGEDSAGLISAQKRNDQGNDEREQALRGRLRRGASWITNA
jgi:hypothetical protein